MTAGIPDSDLEERIARLDLASMLTIGENIADVGVVAAS